MHPRSIKILLYGPPCSGKTFLSSVISSIGNHGLILRLTPDKFRNLLSANQSKKLSIDRNVGLTIIDDCSVDEITGIVDCIECNNSQHFIFITQGKPTEYFKHKGWAVIPCHFYAN